MQNKSSKKSPKKRWRLTVQTFEVVANTGIRPTLPPTPKHLKELSKIIGVAETIKVMAQSLIDGQLKPH